MSDKRYPRWQSAGDMNDPQWQKRWDAPPDNGPPVKHMPIKILVPVGRVVGWIKKLLKGDRK